MRILHTESSNGWGGQEIRILKEAQGMRARGHEIFFAVQKGGKLIPRAKEAGFTVYEVPFKKSSGLQVLYTIKRICKTHCINLINTHSSLDAWIGGIAARLAKDIKVIRTRHLSTPIRKGLNSWLLYRHLADFVVTTSSCILYTIQRQANLASRQLRCIATGIDPSLVQADPYGVEAFRASFHVGKEDILVGTACFVRSWKGILDFLGAASLLKEHKHIKWVVVGGGYVDQYLPKVKELQLEESVIFTGHLERPYDAMAAMDIFALLSTAHEGISQASLQAAYLERPLITTYVGGLPEVCLDEKTGLIVPPFSPAAVAEAVRRLSEDEEKRRRFGAAAKRLVLEKFTEQHMLDQMEQVYKEIQLPLM